MYLYLHTAAAVIHIEHIIIRKQLRMMIRKLIIEVKLLVPLIQKII